MAVVEARARAIVPDCGRAVSYESSILPPSDIDPKAPA
jgi:hypothetical protein